METLQQILDKHSFKPEDDLAELAKAIEQLRAIVPMPFEKEEHSGAIVQKAREYLGTFFQRQFVEKGYTPLEYELFDLKREITADGRNVQIPLLACVELGKPEWVIETGLPNYSNHARIRAKTPLVPATIRTKAFEAIADANDVLGHTLRDKEASRYLLLASGMNSPSAVYQACAPELEILWKPSLEELKIEKIPNPDKDPALLIRFGGRRYVAATWQRENEAPIDHYLREYSTCRTTRR